MTAADITRFVQMYPNACDHVVDLPYRLCSPAAQDPRNIRVWRDETGKPIAFAIIQLQFSTLDWAVAPGHSHLTSEVFAWASARLKQIRAERDQDFGFLIGSSSADDPTVIASGFEDDGWSTRHLSMPLTVQLPSPVVPQGFQIRPLAGRAEVEAYVSLHQTAFDTRNMSVEWRSHVLAHSAYQPLLDLVAENNEGKLVAFCVGWAVDVKGVKTGQIEPLGVLPEEQGKGIGRAILLSALHRMQTLGCETARVDAQSMNAASNRLYESVGFTEDWRSHQYFRLF
jgi:ribosomal protein S18 acetylase RimI-like enzyme